VMRNMLFVFIMNHRIFVSTLLLGVTIFFGWFAAQVKFDNTIETYFLEDDLIDYRRFLEQFGTDEIIAIAFRDEEVFTVENLLLIDTISKKLEDLPHVRRVLSLTTAKIVYGEGESVYFDPLVNEIPSSSTELISIKQRALADPFIPGTLISSDARNTAIVAEIDHIIGEFDYKVDLLNKIRALLNEEEIKTGKHFYVAGTAVLDDALLRYNQRDQSRFMPLMVLIIVAIVFSMFRRLELLVLPIIVIVLSVIWTYGFLVLLGYRINIISTIITPLLMAVAIADSMHFIADYLQEAKTGQLTKSECIESSFSNLLAPCFMTSLTTAFGLLSLLSADLVPIRQFGLVAAAGVLFAFIITIFLLPILLSIIPYPKEKYREQIQRGFFAKLLTWLGHWQKGMAITVILITFLVAIPAVLSLTHLTIGTNTLDYFRKDDVVRLETEWIDASVGGTASLEFFIDAKMEEALKNPSLLQKMEHFHTYLKEIDGITGVYSAVDMVKSLNRAFHGGDQRKFIIPASSIEVAQQLFIVEGSKDIAEFLSDDYSRGRIMARVEMNETQRLAHQMPEIEKRMQEIFGNTATVTPTGMVYLMNQMERYLLSSQIKSFLLAFVVISLAILVMLRSFKLAILAMIPNFLPILFTLAFMPFLGISLDVGTVMIAGVALGLVVDDTIHFLSRLKVEIKQPSDIKNAIANAINSAGRPIIYTSIVLSLGFLVLVLASFNPVVNFGILASIVIFLALVFDLVVLPAIMTFVGPKPKE
ncbi:MAG: RND family transporter, partial [bacterium]